MLKSTLSRFSPAAVLAAASTLVLALGVGLATLTPLPQVVSVGGSDKLHHVLGFAALALPVAVLRPRWLPVVAVMLAFYGGAIELIQPLVGRSCELADWLADLTGIALGGAVGGAVNWTAQRLLRLRTA